MNMSYYSNEDDNVYGTLVGEIDFIDDAGELWTVALIKDNNGDLVAVDIDRFDNEYEEEESTNLDMFDGADVIEEEYYD